MVAIHQMPVAVVHRPHESTMSKAMTNLQESGFRAGGGMIFGIVYL